MTLKEVIWLGDSKLIVREFPDAVREDLGFELYLIQQGKMQMSSRPMKSNGGGVFELKEQDHQGWHRVIYTVQVKGKTYVLHSFKKQSAKTSKVDLQIAKNRLNEI